MDSEQELEDLRQKNEILTQTVHDMYELIVDMREENRALKKTIEDLKNA